MVGTTSGCSATLADARQDGRVVHSLEPVILWANKKQVLAIHYSEPFVMRHQFIEVDRMGILKESFSMNRFMCYVSQIERK